MVVPLFGWSAGDIVVSIKILHAIAEAFQKTTGAKAHYAETSTWLRSFAGDLKRLHDYTREHPQAKYTNDLIEKANFISKHYEAFEKYLQTYDKALSSSEEANKATSAAKTIKWALKELKGQIEALKSAVSAPLLSVNFLLDLQLQADVASVADKVAHLPNSSMMAGLENTFGQLTIQMDYLPSVQANIQRDIERVRLMIQEAYHGPARGGHHELLHAYKDATTQIVEKLAENRRATTQALSTIRESLQDLKGLQIARREGDKLRSTQMEILDSLERLAGISDMARISLKGLSKSLSKLLDNRAEDNKSGTLPGQFVQTAAAVTGIGLAVANIAYVKTSVDGLKKRLPVHNSHQMSPKHGGATNSYLFEAQSQSKLKPVNTCRCPANPNCRCGPACLCGKKCTCDSGTMNTNEASSLSREFLQSSFNAVGTSSTHHDCTNYGGPIMSKLNDSEGKTELELLPDPQHIGRTLSRRISSKRTEVPRAQESCTAYRTSCASRYQRDNEAEKQRPKDFGSLEQGGHVQDWTSGYKPFQVQSSRQLLHDNISNHTIISQHYPSSLMHSYRHNSMTSRHVANLHSDSYAINRYTTYDDDPLVIRNNVQYRGLEGTLFQNRTTTHHFLVHDPRVTMTRPFVNITGIGSWGNEGIVYDHGPLNSVLNEENGYPRGYLRGSSSQNITTTHNSVFIDEPTSTMTRHNLDVMGW